MPTAAEGAGDLTGIAGRLVDIAETVARESEAATATIRAISLQAREVAACAADLEAAAGAIERNASAQASTLAQARQSLAENVPAAEALEQSIAAVTATCSLIGEIAARSRMLSLNARIEAARAVGDGAGFAAVATEMSALSGRTKTASDEIGARTQAVAEDVDRVRRIVASGRDLTASSGEMVDLAIVVSEQQRTAAVAMARTSQETAERIEEAAGAIGRVGSAAIAVKLLARQIRRAAGPAVAAS